VGQHKAVEIQHHWCQHLGVLGNGKALDGHVQCLLGILDVDLDPAARQHRQRILLIAVDVPGQGQRRLAFIITMGKRPPLAYCRHSAMYSNPWDEVAVKVRAPRALAPIQAESAECSDSTCKNSVSSVPSATHWASRSMTTVCGVMG